MKRWKQEDNNSITIDRISTILDDLEFTSSRISIICKTIIYFNMLDNDLRYEKIAKHLDVEDRKRMFAKKSYISNKNNNEFSFG